MHSSPGAVFPPHQKASACHSFQPRNFPFSSRPAGKQRVRRRARVRPCVRILIDSGFGYGFINTSSINFFIYINIFMLLNLKHAFPYFPPSPIFFLRSRNTEKRTKSKERKKRREKNRSYKFISILDPA